MPFEGSSTRSPTQAFQEIKVAMTKAPALKTPAWDHLFYVKTDASRVNIGAIIL